MIRSLRRIAGVAAAIAVSLVAARALPAESVPAFFLAALVLTAVGINLYRARRRWGAG